MDLKGKIMEIGKRLTNISNCDKNITGPIGYLIGATFSLREAIKLNYKYGIVVDNIYFEELKQVAKSIACDIPVSHIKGTRIFENKCEPAVVDGIWYSGYFFNNAIIRIAACAERLGVHPNKGNVPEPDIIRKAREDVNKLKHYMPDCQDQGNRGLLTGRQLHSVELALNAIVTLIDVCEMKGIITSND